MPQVTLTLDEAEIKSALTSYLSSLGYRLKGSLKFKRIAGASSIADPRGYDIPERNEIVVEAEAINSKPVGAATSGL